MMSRSKHTAGFSLIELMIAMVLGIVIVGGCISIFSGVVRSSSVNQTISNLQSNARYILDVMGRDIRAAGFIGCAGEKNVGINVTATNPPTTNISQSAAVGYVVTKGNWLPEAPAAYTAPTSVGSPVAGTHALGVHYAEFPGMVLNESMTSTTSSVVLEFKGDQRLSAGQLMLLSDCNAADLFSISAVNKTSSAITVGTGSSLSKQYTVSSTTRAMPFVSTIYYVGDTQRTSEDGDKVYSLYAHNYPYTAANPPLELIEGVDQLVLEFGVRQVDGSMRYATAGAPGYRPEGIETVRLGLLLSSLESFASVDTTRSFTLAGQRIGSAGAESETGTGNEADPDSTNESGGPGGGNSTVALTYPANKRLRIPFNATFNLRNRNL